MPRALAPALLCVVLLFGCSATPSPSGSAASSGAIAPASPSVGPPPEISPTVEPRSATAGPPSATLPVRGSARDIGEQVLTAAGPAGTVVVSIPSPGGSVLALLDASGQPRPGWPITVKDSTACLLLSALADGSVRAVCRLENPEGNLYIPIAGFAFDSQGASLPGWPVELGCCFAGQRMAGEDLQLLEVIPLGDVTGPGQPYADVRLVTVAADGTLSGGVRVPVVDPCCTWAIGPDGVAYGTSIVSGYDQESPEKSQITALDGSGTQAGWPVTFDGLASGPAIRPDGRVVVTIGTLVAGESRVVAFDPGARAIAGTSPPFPTSTAEFGDTGGCSLGNPQSPLVVQDGTSFVLAWADHAVFALDPSLALMPGWPYLPPTPLALRDSRYVREDAFCPQLGLPAVGPDDTLYLPLEPDDEAVGGSGGGSVVAVAPDGTLRPGWPVKLQRPGAEFWSVVAGSDGITYALAVELESSSTSSASIVAMAPDSTVLYTTTIIDP